MTLLNSRVHKEKTKYRDKKGTVIRDEDAVLWDDRIYEVYKDPFTGDWALDNVEGAPIPVKEVHNYISVVAIKEIQGLSESSEKELIKHQQLLAFKLSTMRAVERELLIIGYEQYVQLALAEGVTPKSMLEFIDEDLEELFGLTLETLEKGVDKE